MGSDSDLLRVGFNSDMMGRFYKIELKPFSFLEFLEFKKFLRGMESKSLSNELSEYMTFGGFPKVIHHVIT